MKKKFKYLIVHCLLLISVVASAHNPDLSSTILVEKGENTWILQIRAALTAFEYEVESHFGKDAFATPEEFQALVVEHVRENLSIKYNSHDVAELKNGKVKLGHETSITFEVIGLPTSIEFLEVENSSFKHIPRNQSALMVLKKGFAKEQFNLNAKNDHTAKLKVANSKIVLTTPTSEENNSSIYFLAVAILFVSVIFFGYKLARKNRTNYSFQNKVLTA